MKKLLTTSLIALTIAFLLPACKGKDKAAGGDPKTVLTAFFDKMAQKDIDGAAKLCTKESKSTLDLMKKAFDAAEGMEKAGAEKKEDDGTEDFMDMEFGETKIDGDKATVSVTNKKKNETVAFPLKLEGGDWKVDFTMSTLMKMGMDASKNKGDDLFKDENATDTTGLKNFQDLFNSDTLKESLDTLKGYLEKTGEMLDKLKENN